jgi:hypothetical protein
MSFAATVKKEVADAARRAIKDARMNSYEDGT